MRANFGIVCAAMQIFLETFQQTIFVLYPVRLRPEEENAVYSLTCRFRSGTQRALIKEKYEIQGAFASFNIIIVIPCCLSECVL